MSLADVTVATAQTGVPPSATTVYLGYLLSGAVGLTARLPKPHRVTFFAQAGYDRAPAIQNLIGDTHDSGGMSFVLGMRVRLGDPR
jgi:hypothetical protein